MKFANTESSKGLGFPVETHTAAIMKIKLNIFLWENQVAAKFKEIFALQTSHCPSWFMVLKCFPF